MAEFPLIYRHGAQVQQPVVGDFEETLAHDPTIRSQSEGGYVTSRARFTRLARRWVVRYEWMENRPPDKLNKDTIKAFEEARLAGSESFDWENPEDGDTYDVRF